MWVWYSNFILTLSNVSMIFQFLNFRSIYDIPYYNWIISTWRNEIQYVIYSIEYYAPDRQFVCNNFLQYFSAIEIVNNNAIIHTCDSNIIIIFCNIDTKNRAILVFLKLPYLLTIYNTPNWYLFCRYHIFTIWSYCYTITSIIPMKG